MPTLAPRPCRAAGCPNYGQREHRGFCAEHKQRATGWRHKESATARGYDADWRRIRAIKLATNPFCEVLNKCKDLPIHRRKAVEVDHKIPFRGNLQLRLKWSNLQSICELCHRAKTARERRGENVEPMPELQTVEMVAF